MRPVFAALVLSLALLFAPSAHAQQIAQLPLTTNDLVYDAVRGKLYASVPASAGTNGNSIAVIDPVTAAVERYVAIGADPTQLALSADAQYLYVGLDGAKAVRRLTLATLEPGLQFSLGSDPSFGAYSAAKIEVFPAQPGSVVVARWNGTRHSVAIYDDGVLRPATVDGYFKLAVAISATGSRVYRFNTGTTGAELVRMSVGASGLTVLDQIGSFFEAFQKDIALVDGVLFGSAGVVADPESLARVGVLGGRSTPFNRTYYGVAADTASHRAYAIESLGIRAFDLATLRPLWFAAAPSPVASNSETPDLVLAGSNRLAYRGNGQVVIVGLDSTQPLVIGIGGTGHGRVTSQPAGITCGGGGAYYTAPGVDCARLFPDTTSVTLTATPLAGSRLVEWAGDADCADGVVSMSSARACTAVFEQVVAGVALQVPMASNDVVYSSLTQKLYVSVPGGDPTIGNTLTELDAATGAPGRSLWVGSEPRKLAVSDDGRYLFVGLNGEGSVRRVDLTTFTAEPAFSLGRHQYYGSLDSSFGAYIANGFAVQPGAPETVAVSLGLVTGTSGGAVAVYDNGVQRPTITSEAFSGIVFGATPTALYGFGSGFARLSVGSTGVAVLDQTGQMQSAGTRSAFGAGIVYSGSLAIDPSVQARAGTFPMTFGSSVGTGTFLDSATDVGSRRHYALTWSDATSVLKAFDLDTFAPVWKMTLPDVWSSLGSMAVITSDRLAVRTDRLQVFLVGLSASRQLTVAKGGTGNGTIVSTPAAIDCGSSCAVRMAADATVTLTATANSDSRFVGWAGDSDCLDGMVTMSATRSCTAVFAQLTVGLGVQLPLVVNDLAYSPATGKLYASIPGKTPGVGNTIAVIDPLTGVVGPSIWVGSEPNRLAVSSDGSTLHVGLDGVPSVRSLDLATLTPGPPFRLGQDSVRRDYSAQRGIVAVPGDSSSVVAILDYGAALYTAGVMRPATVGNFVDSVAFSDSPTRAYAKMSSTFARLDVGPSGFSEVDLTSLLSGSGANIRFDGGRLYGDAGPVYDPEAKTQVGTFPVASSYSPALVIPDVARGVVNFLESPTSASRLIRRYDPATFALLDSTAVPGAAGISGSFIATGVDRFAFRTNAGQVFLFARGTAVTHTLVVTASGLASSVPIAIDVPDRDGLSAGTTPMLRTYAAGTAVTLTAAATVDDMVFYRWTKGGTVVSTTPALAMTVSEGTTLTAAYRYRAPTVSAILPSGGPATGGTVVTVTGTDFRAGAAVRFGTTYGTSVVVVDSTTITVTAPAHALGEVAVTVFNTDSQSGSLTHGFTYRVAPSITAVMPSAGPTAGGTALTITGAGFLPGAAVTVGGLAAAAVTVVDGATITATSPAHAAGPANVVVTNTDAQQGVLSGGFTYQAPVYRRYFAEGASSGFFDCYFAILNPSETETATVTLTFLRYDSQTFAHTEVVPPLTRRTVDVKTVPGMANAPGFSTVIESDVEIVADRTMSWDASGYGSHAETSIKEPAQTWYLAEGATQNGFQLYYCIENPNADPVDVEVTYLRRAPNPPLTITYPNIPGYTRKTIYVNGEDARLSWGDVSGVITSLTPGRPIIVERAMYLNSAGSMFNAGHASAGVTAPATDWFLAEGATVGTFDMYITLANPGAAAGTAVITYMLTDGRTVVKSYPVAASSRQTVWVNGERDDGDPTLTLSWKSLSARIQSTVPIIVERSMWWAAVAGGPWIEAHNAAGTTETGTVWAAADGEQGGSRYTETYVVVANTSPFPGRIRVTALGEDGTTPWTERDVPANSRTTLWMGGTTIEAASPFGGLLTGKKFGVIVESLATLDGTAQIVVERAMYSDANGVVWAAGTDVVATKLK